MDYCIQFITKKFDSILLAKILFYLVSRGVKYNAIERAGPSAGYAIYAKHGEEDVEVIEKDALESTEKLADIINTYSKYDVTRTHLSIDLDYISDVNFYFSLSIVPKENYGEPVIRNLNKPGQGSSGYYYDYESNPTDDGRKWFIIFNANTFTISDEIKFLTFISLCEGLFERFNLPYGSYVSEYDEDLPVNEDELLPWLKNVNFFYKPLVDKIGREKLLTAPAKRVIENKNGGIMLLICPVYDGLYGCNEVEIAFNHIYNA